MTFNINSVLASASIGVRRRISRIFDENGRSLVVPVDDSLISYEPGLVNLDEKLSKIISAKPNAIICFPGTATLIKQYDIPLIINVTASTKQSTHTNKTLVSSVERALALDASAVAVHLNLSSQYETTMLNNIGIVSEQCQRYGMPLLVIAYPRKEHFGKDENYKTLQEEKIEEYTNLVSHCVRVAFELGADIIKTQFTGSAVTFKEVVAAAVNKPILIAGGELIEETVLLNRVQQAMSVGAAGISFGRNIFNRDDASKIIEKAKKIIFAEVK